MRSRFNSCPLALLLVAALLGMCGCSTQPRLTAVPPAYAGSISFLHVDNARFDADDGEAFLREYKNALARERLPPSKAAPTFLALSGGREDGAFAAGLLVGWSERGSRPTFKLVTGTSTGAIAAPFAFLGAEYDHILEKIYTTTSADDVASKRFLVAAINEDAMLDNSPLARMIAKYLDANILRRIAEEYEKGRLLFISTTNLDTGKLMIWNIGAIAASPHPLRLALVRKIILASAAVPGLFPPVMLDVALANGRHQEMHVDGGTVAQAFLYPSSVRMGLTMTATKAARPVAYVIRNGRVTPVHENVERKTLSIAGRAIETMISSNGVGTLYKIFAATQRDGVDFNLALITDDFTEPYTQAFDKSYMRKLFDFARTRARSGYAWQKQPPGFSR